MPADALPQPRALSARAALPGTVTLRHEYLDALGRPLTGTVTLIGKAGARLDGITVPPAPVTAELAGGVLEVALLPDVYHLEGSLRTKEGARVSVRDEITLQSPASRPDAL